MLPFAWVSTDNEVVGNFEWWGQERKIKRTSQPKSGGWVEVGDVFFLIFALIASDFNRHIITIIINGENGVDENFVFCLNSIVLVKKRCSFQIRV